MNDAKNLRGQNDLVGTGKMLKKKDTKHPKHTVEKAKENKKRGKFGNTPTFLFVNDSVYWLQYHVEP